MRVDADAPCSRQRSPVARAPVRGRVRRCAVGVACTGVAGVRGRTEGTVYPKNLPEDVSALAWQGYMSSPLDHHSVSHMPASQFANIWCVTNKERLQGIRPEYAVSELLGCSYSDEFEYRVVFWFDN